MISEASSALQGLLGQVGGKTEQKSGGPSGFLALMQGNSEGNAGKSGAQALLASLKGDGAEGGGNGTALQGEALQNALRSALSGLSGQGGSGKGQTAIIGKDGVLSEDALEDLASALVELAQGLERGGLESGALESGALESAGDAPGGLLNALAQLGETQGKEQAVAAVEKALARLNQKETPAQAAQPFPGNSETGADALSKLQDRLDSLLQQLEGTGASPAGAQDQEAAPSLSDLLDSLEAAVAQLKEAAGQDSKRHELLSDLQAQLSDLQDSLGENGDSLDLASLLAAAEAQVTTTGKTAVGQAAPSANDALADLGRQLDSLLQGLKAASNGKGAQEGDLQGQLHSGQAAGSADDSTLPAPQNGGATQNDATPQQTQGNSQEAVKADRGQAAARDGEQASRQAAVTASAEQQEQLAQRQQANQSLSDRQAAELYESLRQAGKALQNEAATQALERNLARLSEQTGGVNRLAEALASLQGREESLTASSSSRGPDSLNALSFENQLRASAQAQQAAAQAQQAAKSQGGPAADQIAMKIHKAVAGGNDRISVQLHPAELGRVDVKLDFGQDGLLRASITAERPETLDLLQRDARALERALGDAGVKTDSGSLNFNARDTAGQQQAFDQGQGGGATSNGANGSAPGEEISAGTADDESRPGLEAGLINLSV
ncbi:flagellar hook-length control protein FliK [Fodinicurvata fenggangensis]|uniref:flagellar hook-length control protein FliK n=1 Tax=Fodinicurvata fenggangensis TaxID=1121830 RepID=UPI000478A87E|nr:flagellar hook-length control protein FliK [Fodinicurvata fenggangensis]